MEENGWLRHILETMQSDIDEIKKEIRSLSEWKWKVAGSVAAVSAFITVVINVIHIWMRA